MVACVRSTEASVLLAETNTRTRTHTQIQIASLAPKSRRWRLSSLCLGDRVSMYSANCVRQLAHNSIATCPSLWSTTVLSILPLALPLLECRPRGSRLLLECFLPKQRESTIQRRAVSPGMAPVIYL